jgi:PhnB protein
MPATNNYLFFHGNCADAMRFYQKTLGGKLDLMTHAQAPAAAKVPPGSADRILHARLLFDDGGVLMASDDMVTDTYKGMNGFYVSIIYPTAAEAKRVFDGLAKGGKVNMPFDKSFWAEGFGMVVDRFGTPWMVNGAMVPTP